MSDNTLDNIRKKTEETDLDTILKTSMGGYTKKSVSDYLSFIKKQQQDMKEAFSEQIGCLQKEKENLQKKNAELESDINEAVLRIRRDEDELDKLREEAAVWHSSIAEEKAKTEAAEQKAAELAALLDEANAKNEELDTVISCMDQEPFKCSLGSVADIELPSDEEEQKAAEQMSLLLAGLSDLKTEMAERSAVLEEQLKYLEEMTSAQLKNSRGTLEKLQCELQNSLDRSELLECEKESLTQKISELSQRNMVLDRENTKQKAANFILQRRLGS